MNFTIENGKGILETKEGYEVFFEWIDKNGNKNSIGVREGQDLDKYGLTIECGLNSSQLLITPIAPNIVRIKTN